jgi:hypothetical protein
MLSVNEFPAEVKLATQYRTTTTAVELPLQGAGTDLISFLPAGSHYALHNEPPPFCKVVRFLLQSRALVKVRADMRRLSKYQPIVSLPGGRMGVVNISVRLPSKHPPSFITQQKCTTGKIV